MTLLKPTTFGVCLSLALHAGMVMLPVWGRSPASQDALHRVQIDYVEYPAGLKEPPPAPRDLYERMAKPKNKRPARTGIPVFNRVAGKDAATVSGTDLSDSKKERILKEVQALAHEQRSEAPRTSTEMMANPQQGKIFIGYFSEIKKKIQETLTTRYSTRFAGEGGVAVNFVLNAKGEIVVSNVSDEASSDDFLLKELALRCLRDAAPFGEFPEDLGKQNIAFHLKIFFDDRSHV